MSRHLSFWIGFFAAALVIVPVAVGAWGVTQGFARDWAATFFIVICTIVGLLVVGLLFRGAILRRLTGRAEATVEDISSTLISGVSAAVAQDRATAEREADKLARVVLGWYAWSNFYRWVIGTALALLLAFASFTGTVLLFEQIAKLEDQTRVMQAQQELMDAQTRFMESQTQRLEEQTEAAAMQNEIMTLNLVNEIRDQMLASVEQRPLGEWLATVGTLVIDEPLARYATEAASCGLHFDLDYPLNSAPSPAAIGAITQLAQSDALGQRVVDALNLLAGDSHGSVALGAVLVLQNVSQPFASNVILRDLFLIEPIRLSGHVYDLSLRRSYVSSLICPDCQIHISASFYQFNIPVVASGGYNLVVNSGRDDPVGGVIVAARDALGATWVSREPAALDVGPYFPETFGAWLTRHKDLPACQIMSEIARVNPLLTTQPTR